MREIVVISKKPVVVGGSGIIGCAIAREVAVSGVACTVVDDRPVGGGATRASAGMLAPHVEAHEGGPLLDLAVRSLDLYDDWIANVRRESEIDVEYRRIGTLQVALDTPHAEPLRRRVTTGGVPTFCLVPSTPKAAHPALGATPGALLAPSPAYVAATP